MARTKINFDKKKQEILHSVWDILLKYGYEEMTISVILKELSISRGAFYHYCRSKEECVDAAIAEYVSGSLKTLETMDDPGLPAAVRLQKAIQNGAALSHSSIQQDQIINRPENAVFHQKLMIAFTKLMAPYYSSIIQDGIKSREFAVQYPLETAEMLLTLSNFYLDSALFEWAEESIAGRIKALEEMANKSLGTQNYIHFFDLESQV